MSSVCNIQRQPNILELFVTSNQLQFYPSLYTKLCYKWFILFGYIWHSGFSNCIAEASAQTYNFNLNIFVGIYLSVFCMRSVHRVLYTMSYTAI